MNESALNSGSFDRISHGVSFSHPVSLKPDRWDRVGPGMRDMHYEVELGIVVEGKMRREFASKTVELSKNTVWTQGIWEPHSAFVVEKPLEILVIHLHPAFLYNLTFTEGPQLNWLASFSTAPSNRPNGGIVPPEKLRIFIKRLYALDSMSKFYGIELRLCAMELLLCIMEHWADESCFSRPGEMAIGRLDKALNMVFASREFVSVEAAAEKCNMSRNGFNKFFSKHMGLNFATFALHHRLSSAAAELTGSDKPIKAIASSWGFTDTSHFYRRFADVYDRTPAEYRQGRKK